MKTYLRRFDVDRAHVAAAYAEWTRSQAGRQNSWRVAREHGSADALIDEITAEIAARELEARPIAFRDIVDPANGKQRRIGVESVKQQVVDYVAVTALEPLIAARTGYWQVASVKGKGGAHVATALRKWTRGRGWFAHIDVRKCYPSIRPDVVMRLLERRVASADVLYVCRWLLSTYEGGLSIGSYFSLRMCQLALSEAYHHLEGLRSTSHGRGRALVAHQIWYIDDALLFCRTKRELRRAVRELEAALGDLGLSIKPWKACRLGSEHAVLAGWRALDGRLGARRAVWRRARRAMLRARARPSSVRRARRAAAYWGWVRPCGRRARSRWAPTARTAGKTISRAERSPQ